MADETLQRRFRQHLNRYQQIEQWLGDRLRRRAKAPDWLRNHLIRAVLFGSDEAQRLEERLRTANPPTNRVDYFRGVFDGLRYSGTDSLEFDSALDDVLTLITACAFLQEQGLRSIRRIPTTPNSPDFIAATDAGELLVATVNLRRCARELYRLYDALAAYLLLHPELGRTGLLVFATLDYLIARYEDRLRWPEHKSDLDQLLSDATVAALIATVMETGRAVFAEGLFGIEATTQDGLHLRLLPPGQEVPPSEHPLFLAARLEISTNVGWMHNHALANDFRFSYLLFLDATTAAEGVPSAEALNPLLRDYMALMWETNPKVSLHVLTDTGDLHYPAPGMPTAAL